MKIKGVGYITIKDENDDIVSIWHDGATPHTNKLKPEANEEYGKVLTSTVVPSFENNAPHVFIHESQVGLKSKNFTITIFKESFDRPLSTKKLSFKGEYITVDTSLIEEFKNITGEVNISINFFF